MRKAIQPRKHCSTNRNQQRTKKGLFEQSHHCSKPDNQSQQTTKWKERQHRRDGANRRTFRNRRPETVSFKGVGFRLLQSATVPTPGLL